MTRTTLKRLGIAIVCGVVGLAINIWRTGSSAPLLVGRMVTLPVAILFGPWFGIIASVIAAPAGIGIFANGVSLQMVASGLVGVVIVDLTATFAANRIVAVDPGPARRLRGDAFHAFVLAATVPVLLLASVDGQITSSKQEVDGSARLHEAVTALNQHIGAYVLDHEHAVQSLASALTALPSDDARRQALLEQYHQIYPSGTARFPALQSLGQDDLLLGSSQTDRGVFHYQRKTESGGEAARLAAVAVMAPTGWKVFVEQPLANIRLQSTGYYVFALSLM